MTTKLRFALLSLFLVLAACGGGDTTETDEDAGVSNDAANNTSPNANTGNDAGTNNAGGDAGADAGDTNTCDDDPPSVATNPTSPVSVAYDAGSVTIRLDFDEPVSGVTPEAFTVDNGATIDAVGGSDDIYDVTVAGLQAGTTYTVTLPSESVVDTCDNALDETLELSIVVDPDPCDSDDVAPTFVVQPTPPIEVMSGTTSTTVTLLFSEEIQGVSPTVNNGAAVGNVANPQGNDWTVEVTGLSDGTTTVTVPTSTLDVCGNALAATQTFDIVVGSSDGTPPMVISSTPNNGESGVALDSNIVFEFSEPMDTTAGTIDLTANGTAVTFTSAWSSGDRVLTIDPDNDFANGDGVVAVLNNFADLAGNALPNEVLAFTAIPDPCSFDNTPPAFSTTPTSPITLSPGTTRTTFVLNFTEPVTGVTLSALSISGTAAITAVVPTAPDTYNVSVANLEIGTNTVTVPASVADQCGNTLGAARTVNIIGRSLDQIPPTIVSTSPVDGATNVARDSDIVVNWSEPMNQSVGFATIRANGVNVNRALTWDNATTLRLDPNVDLPFGASIDVILNNFTDAVNNPAGLQRIGFTVEPDPCAVYPSSVNVLSTDQDAILADSSGEVWVLVELSDLFTLTESQVSVTPVTGSGSLATGSLTGANDTWAFRLTGTAPGDSYTINIGTGTANAGCTSLTAASYTVDVPDTISVGGSVSSCPLPAQSASHFNGGDACDATATNDTRATATPTGLVVDAIGDRISFGGIYDSDQSTDSDYFTFDVVEDGTTTKDLLVEVYYGCSFTAAPTANSGDFDVRMLDTSGFTMGSFFTSVPEPFDAFDQNVAAVARATRTADGAAGTNAYYIEINEQAGGSWCTDWIAFVEVIDSGRPASCANTPANVSIENVPQVAFTNEFTGEADIEINLSSDFGFLSAQDIAVIPLGGARGSLKPGSLNSTSGGYTAQLGGVQAGETYLVTLSTGATSCTLVEGSGFFVTISDDPTDAGTEGVCPLPGPLAQNHVAADACNSQTNGGLGTSEPTGFTLTNPGDRFSIQGTLDTDFITQSDDDWFSFEVAENGTNIYTLDVALLYGCDFADTSGNNDGLTLNVVDDAGNVIATSVGAGVASTTGDLWRSVRTTLEVGEVVAGNYTYHIEVDDQFGTGLCMDYVVYAELTDVSGNAACVGRNPTANLATTSQGAPEVSGTATAVIDLDSGYTLTAGDLSLTANTGTGTLDATSFTLVDGSTYSIDITGVAVGDDYTITVAGGTDACGTTFAGGTVDVNVQNIPNASGSCPLPPPLPNNFARAETCGDTDSNSSQSTAANTGFTLANVGDAFSITSTYDTSGSPGDNDWFSFQIDNSTTSTFNLDVRLAYGCNITGGTASGSDEPTLEIRDPSGLQVGSALLGDLSYSSIASGASFGFDSGTIGVTPINSGVSTYYIWLDDIVASNFCFDYVVYVTVDSKT